MTAAWPARNEPAPRPSHLYDAAVWLVSRHPQLADLVELIPDAIVVHPDSDTFLDLLAVQREVLNYDRELDQSLLEQLSLSEQVRLRLLATLAPGNEVAFRPDHLSSLDADGRALLEDWFVAIRAQVQR